jgi:orotidine-5'-phosphate decarboxylase
MSNENTMKKLILALDVADRSKALGLVKSLSEWGDVFKVGPILFIKEGPAIIEEIRKLGKEVFLDLKLHDIPETVKRAVQSAQDMGVYSMTLHSIGGREMLSAAAKLEKRPKLWAVTVLTSQNSGIDEVIRRAELAKESGVDGVIASANEAEAIKSWAGKDFTVVTPGIRLEQAADDQKRVATPGFAMRAGADFIVVGRPILEAKDPAGAARKIEEEIISVMSKE